MLSQMIDYYAKGNKSEFARMIGLSPQGVSSWIQRGMFDAEVIYAKCVKISAEWLLTGEGDMIIKKPLAIENNSGDNKNSPIENKHYYSESPDVLRAQIDLLDIRIKEKDAQIKEKDAQIAKLLDILNQRK